MKLTTTTQVSVDGVMQGLGGPEEDRSGGFERGGWAMPHFDSETAALVGQVYGRADAFLFGRRTYEVFRLLGSDGRFRRPHRRGVEHPAQIRRVDHAHRPAVGGHDRPLRGRRGRRRRAESQAGGELQVVGSLSLARLLLDNDLILVPVLLGSGVRLFDRIGDDQVELERERIIEAPGVTHMTFRVLR